MNRSTGILGIITAAGAIAILAAGVVILRIDRTERATYQAVDGAEETIAYGLAGVDFHDDYAIKDDRLYLLVSRVHSNTFGRGSEIRAWSESDIADFRAKHPQLDRYWPDVTAPAAGVNWIVPRPIIPRAVLPENPVSTLDPNSVKFELMKIERFDLVLSAVGERKIAVIKLVRQVTGLGLAEAKAIVDAAPNVVQSGLAREAADELAERFRGAGASVEVKPADPTETSDPPKASE